MTAPAPGAVALDGSGARKVILHEVGLRDGLQMEKQVVPLEQKIRWTETLLTAGVDIIQLGSFVHPGKVPQMADTDALFRHFSAPGRKPAGAILSGLVLNEKGLERGMACGVDMFCMGVSASETHSQKNTGMSIADATARIIAMAKQAAGAGKKVQLSVQSAFGCGFEGPVPPERVLGIAEQFLKAGFRNLSLADTAGQATPAQVERLFGGILKLAADAECTCHFHNTYGLGMANCCAAMDAGVRCFESSVAGLGGCPFTKVAGGNVCTEDLVHYLHRLGQRPEVNLDRLVELARDMSRFFGRELPGMIYKVGQASRLPPRQALEGIRVLDMTNVLAGPFATLHLALLGAEVIKIENPTDGDLARKLGNVPKLNQELMGTSFLAQNSNKKSLTLNLKAPEGREIFKKLVATADVLVENFRPDVMKRLGLDYPVLTQINPRLVYCAISGFGQTGPDAFKPAYDQIIQGLSGVMAINGDERLNPLRAGFPVCDTVGGLNAAFATLAALFHRERTGEGQFIDVALLDSIMPLAGWVAANLLIGKQRPVLMGNDNFTAAPSGTFVTKDGYINIAANKQEQWEAVADLLGVPELKTDPRFQERDSRKKNRKALTPLLEVKLKEKETSYWVELLNKNDVPSGAILSLEAALNQPQVRHRQTLQKVGVEGVGELQLFGLSAKLEKTPGGINAPPPRLSAHTNEILGRLGYPEADLRRLKEARVI